MDAKRLDNELEHLRHLLLGEEYDELLRLRDSYNDEEQFSRKVASVLAESLKFRAQSDESIARVLSPTIEDAITSSIDNNPGRLAAAFYPIMGPAIRKSIAETMQQMLENLNQLLESSFSLRSMRWRIDAWQSGRRYSEVVLLNTLEYRVEQVFLIHRDSGLLIAHQVNDQIKSRDPDMVSGMMSAIQSFIQDSFTDDTSQSLDTVRVGDLNLQLQSGPQAVLALVVRGPIPESLRQQQHTTLEKLHRFKRESLQRYAGDANPDYFADVHEDLQRLLLVKHKDTDRRGRIPWRALIALVLLASIVSYALFLQYRSQQQQQNLLAMLQREPGIQVLDSEPGGPGLMLQLLLDPLARAPAEVIADQPQAERIAFQSSGYLALESPMIERRAILALQPEPDTQLSVQGSRLLVSGRASEAWVKSRLATWVAIPGLVAIDSSALQVHNPSVEQMRQLVQAIEQVKFTFAAADTSIAADARLDELAQRIRELNELSHQQFQRPAIIDIVGYTDDSGSLQLNARLGRQRAEVLEKALRSKGLNDTVIEAYNSFEYGDSESSKRMVGLVVRGSTRHGQEK